MLTDQDVDRLRAETPGADSTTHFNHAGASLTPASVTAAMIDQLRTESMLGPHEAGALVEPRLERARADAAALLGAGEDEVAFVSAGSAGWGLGFAALPGLKAGDRVLVGRHEWGGNVSTLLAATRRSGATLEVIPCRADGAVDPDALEAMIDDRVRLVSLTWLPANGGLINDAAAIGTITRRHGIPYVIDAAQALGQLPIDVRALGCDLLAAAARKHLRGPRGTALLYVRREFLPTLRPVFLDAASAPWSGDGGVPRPDARVFETYETSVALRLGLGAAIALALDIGVDRIRARVAAVAGHLRDRLGRVPGVVLRDLGAGERSALVSFTIEGLGASAARQRLAGEHAISVAANGLAYTPYDMTQRGLNEIVRAAVSYLTTEAEIDRLVAAVGSLSPAHP